MLEYYLLALRARTYYAHAQYTAISSCVYIRVQLVCRETTSDVKKVSKFRHDCTSTILSELNTVKYTLS